MPHPTRVALITGCGKPIGIGNSTARALAAKGVTVVVSDLRPTGVANEYNAPEDIDTNWGGVDTLVEQITKSGGTASAVLGDVGREEDASRMVEEVWRTTAGSTSSSTMPARRREPTATRSRTCRSPPGI